MADDDNVQEVICDDMTDMVAQVCSLPPQPPHSIQFECDWTSPESTHQIFQKLGHFLTDCLVYLFGEQVDLLTLSQKEIELVQNYMKSLGWQVVINPTSEMVYPKALPYVLIIPNKKPDAEPIKLIFQPL